MAKYKHTEAENGQGIFLSINLKEQLLPGTFEYMLNDLIGRKIDISSFDSNYNNDTTGAKAIPPRVLIKLIIYGYKNGMKSSREIDELGRNNITAKALAEDMEPHWTTIASFISKNNERFIEIFEKILTYCAELKLIGGETFAIDGCRLPSNASIELTGTAEDMGKRLKIYQRMAKKHIAKHKRQDEQGQTDDRTEKRYKERQKAINRQIEKISDFINTMERKKGKRGQEIQSNVTDNESAMIHTSSGYIQGYIGIAVCDKKEQVIVSAKAAGSANECEHFPQMLDDTIVNLKEAGIKQNKKMTILADKNFFCEENLRKCDERGIEAIIPDSQYKKRLGRNGEIHYEADDFKYNKKYDYYLCPGGRRLTNKGAVVWGGKEGNNYQADVKDCRVCKHYSNCIRSKKKRSEIKRGRVLWITESNKPGNLCTKMRRKLNMEAYQDRYSYRIGIIEPVFANITNCKKLNRFSLRGAEKVNGQWQLYCITHNLGKCLEGYNKKRGYA